MLYSFRILSKTGPLCSPRCEESTDTTFVLVSALQREIHRSCFIAFALSDMPGVGCCGLQVILWVLVITSREWYHQKAQSETSTLLQLSFLQHHCSQRWEHKKKTTLWSHSLVTWVVLYHSIATGQETTNVLVVQIRQMMISSCSCNDYGVIRISLILMANQAYS